MLTVAFVTTTLALLATAAPSPISSRQSGLRIPLTKRGVRANNDGVVDRDALSDALQLCETRVAGCLLAYERNTNTALPVDASGLSHLDLAPLTDKITHKQSAGSSGAVPLTDDNNGELWQGPLTIGTPAKTFTVQFDTGSSDLFVPGVSCRNKYCKGHAMYNPKKSFTAMDMHQEYTLSYGSGNVTVEEYSDTVSIAGFTATKQKLGAASEYSSSFGYSNFPADGLMGMAYQSISEYNAPPVFQTLLAQKQIANPVFSFKLASSGAELFLGGADNNLYTGSFTYAPVTAQGYWMVNGEAITVNDTTPLKNFRSVIDTGTTLIVAPASQVMKFYGAIPGSKNASATVGTGFYTFPCSSTQYVSLTFGGKAFDIAPDLFNLGRVSSGSSDCVGALVGSNTIPFWVVGDTFLQNVYSTFDLGNNRVGFATLK